MNCDHFDLYIIFYINILVQKYIGTYYLPNTGVYKIKKK